MGEGRKGVRHIADCAVYGEEQNGEWELPVDIDGLTHEKTPDPFVSTLRHQEIQNVTVFLSSLPVKNEMKFHRRDGACSDQIPGFPVRREARCLGTCLLR